MIEYSEKYKSYAEEFPDAIVCWKEPAENHTEEGEKITLGRDLWGGGFLVNDP